MSILPRALISNLEAELGTSIKKCTSVSGGDINDAYQLFTTNNLYFLKTNTYDWGAKMLAAESLGLKQIREIGALAPEVFETGTIGQTHYLLLEWIPRGNFKSSSWEEFASNLAALHKYSADQFGLETDNFIGSLYQSNKSHKNWIDFYFEKRIYPQIKLAIEDSKFSHDILDLAIQFRKSVEDLLPSEAPSFIHGDLWSGNYIVNTKGHIFLVDPAVSYSNREMDVAMSLLFGGFPGEFYDAYNSVFPLIHNWRDRIEIYQLYYLLVHVNLFAGHYISQSKAILKKFA